MKHLLRASDTMPVFAMFYEHWCPHCFKAKRVFEQAAGFFLNFIKFVKVLPRPPALAAVRAPLYVCVCVCVCLCAQVDCGNGASNRALCAAHNVTNVPTFVLFSVPPPVPVAAPSLPPVRACACACPVCVCVPCV